MKPLTIEPATYAKHCAKLSVSVAFNARAKGRMKTMNAIIFLKYFMARKV